MSGMLDAVLAHAARGFKVFAVEAGGKRPWTEHGFLDATSDPGELSAMFGARPGAGVAIRTGQASGVVVIDVDVKNGIDGFASLAGLEAECGPLRETFSVQTPSGGLHLFFAVKRETTGPSAILSELLLPDVSVKSGTKLRPGIDVRAEGGYVVAAPTVLPNGAYTVVNDIEPVPLPDALLQVLTAKPAASTSAGGGFLATHNVLDGIAEGQRDDILLRATSGWRRRHQADADGGRAAVTVLALEAARNCTPPFPEAEALKKVDQAFKMDHGNQPRRSLDDDGNALRLVDQHGDELRWVEDANGFYVYNGQFWVPGSLVLATGKAREVARLIGREAEDVADGELAKKILAWARQSRSRGRIEAMPALAKTDPRIAAILDDFDSDLFLLNARNGTVDLRTGERRPHRREDLISRMANAAYDPTAKAPMWDSFLARVTQGSVEMIDFLQLLAGYSATGLAVEEKVVIIHGSGGNGKSKFIGALHHALGGYSVEADAQLLVKGKNERHSDALFHIVGARLVIASEVDPNAKLDEEFFKKLSGGDTINARRLYAQSRDYRPTWQIVWSTNNLPSIEHFDDAVRRRVVVVPFMVKIPPEEADKAMQQRLEAEADGILRWIVEGAVRWHQAWARAFADPTMPNTAFTLPAEVVAASRQYEIDEDPLAEFIEDCCVLGFEFRTHRKELYSAYLGWCMRTGEQRPITNRQFFSRVRDRKDLTIRSDRTVQGLGFKRSA